MIAWLGDQLAVPLSEAQAVYRALAAPRVYRELVEDSGWSVDKFASWVAHALEGHLLHLTGQPVATGGERDERRAWSTRGR